MSAPEGGFFIHADAVPDIAPLLRACGMMTERQMIEAAILTAHRAIVRCVGARSRRAQIRNGKTATALLNDALKMLKALP